MKKTMLRYLISCVLLAGLSACQTSAVTAPTPQPTASAGTAAASSSAASSEPSSGFGSVAFSQSGQSPDFTIKVKTPVLNGSNDPHTVAFNLAVSGIIQKQVADFKKNLADVTPPPLSTGSSMDLEYTVFAETDNLISLQLKTDEYMAGAAHPFQTSTSLNYDLPMEKVISLDQLFAPGANYLQTISDYCKNALNKTDLAASLFSEGFTPTSDNYRNWNITSQGLVITFDEYQVAPYAAGPQTVVIPYPALKDIIAAQGPLAEFAK